jgi:hypothetical protein
MRERSAYRRGEAAIAAALLGLGVYVVWSASAMPAGSLAQPGPAVFPFGIGVLLAVAGGAILAGLGLKGPAGEAAPLGRDAAVAIVVLAAAAVAFERTGALATFAVMLLVLHFTLARGPWWKSMLFGLAGAAAAWALFARVLGVGLPGPGF